MKIELTQNYQKKREALAEKLRKVNEEIRTLVHTESEKNPINILKGKKVIIDERKTDPFYFDHIEPTHYKTVMVYGYQAKKDGTPSKSIRTYIAGIGDSLNEVDETVKNCENDL